MERKKSQTNKSIKNLTNKLIVCSMMSQTVANRQGKEQTNVGKKESVKTDKNSGRKERNATATAAQSTFRLFASKLYTHTHKNREDRLSSFVCQQLLKGQS